MRTVFELTREELTEVKTRYYCETNDNVSWGEIANIDEIVTDEEIFEEYSEYFFVDDDFSCNMEA